MKKQLPQKYIFAGLMVLLLFLTCAQFHLPEIVPADAPANEFSAARAIQRLEPLVKEPHSAGTPELAAVRETLIDQLESFGLEVEIQSTIGTLPQYFVAGEVDNIVARMPGTDSSGAILLMAHYDSVPQGPGAGDNGAGVVTILETLRALETGLPLKNDIIVLYTDAEEYGTLGAQAFFNQHPWMEDIEVVLNVEGTLLGSVVLVETGPQNGWFVRQFRDASPHALGYSWLYDLFGMMPNLTDFMPFREGGYAGGNLFTFNGGSQYHTPHDTIENMDVRSLQQHGEQILALVQRFGTIDLSQPHASDVIYFNLYQNLMVVYPARWALPIAMLCTLFVLATMIFNINKEMNFKHILKGFLNAVLSLVGAVLIIALLWFLIQKIHPQYTLYMPAHSYNDGWYAAAFACIAAAITTWGYAWVQKTISWREHLIGAMLLYMLLNLAVSILAPGFSYLFTIPLLTGLSAFWLWRNKELPATYSTIFGLAGFAAIVMLIWLPVGLILYWSSGLSFWSAIVVATVLMMLMLIPQMKILMQQKYWILPAILASCGFFGLIGGSLTSQFTMERPMPLRMQYFFDSDINEASWIHSKAPQSDWQAQFIEGELEEMSWEEIFPPFSSTILRSEAPVLPLNPPTIQVSGDEQNGDIRTITLHITPARSSDQIILSIPPETTVLSALVDGHHWMETNPEALPLENWRSYYFIAPQKTGLQIELEFKGDGPKELLITERSVGLDTLPHFRYDPRPPDVITLGDYVFVSQSLNLK